MARYLTFYSSLLSSACNEVGFLAQVVSKDVRSTTSKNLKLIKDETGLNPLNSSPSLLMMKVKKAEVPANQSWRMETLDFLLKDRRSRESRMENTDTISSVIDALCSV